MSAATQADHGRPRVLCIAPAWNEQDAIGDAVAAVPREVVEAVVVVDDGSTDATAARASEAGAIVLTTATNCGVGAAIRRGFQYGTDHGFDIFVVISGAGKTPADQIPALIEPIVTGAADLVQGSRYLSGGVHSHMPLSRRLGTRLYTGLFRMVSGSQITDASCGLRAIRAGLVEDGHIDLELSWLDRYGLEPYLLLEALRHKYRVAEVPVSIRYPAKGPYTKMRSLSGWWSIVQPLVRVAWRLGRQGRVAPQRAAPAQGEPSPGPTVAQVGALVPDAVERPGQS